jgi:hypothetical protein
MKDFISEIPMYEHTEKIVNIVSGAIYGSESIETNLFNAYEALLKEGVVCGNEIKTLETWLTDIKTLLL